jgi:thiamine-phosphate pyrophosphorylase
LVHWLLALLQEEEGRPALLLEPLALPRQTLLDLLAEQLPESRVAPEDHELYDLASDLGMTLRGDPHVTTEMVFLAVATLDTALHARWEKVGFRIERLEALLRAPEIATEEEELPGAEFQIAEPKDHLEAARILDVNLNRARESLRILDDYVRFVRNDSSLTERIKQLRHDLVDASALLNPQLLLAARDTVGDVGVSISTVSEYERPNAGRVALVNLKRLEEALRGLEEFGKILSPEFARRVEELRYRTYTLEKVLVRGARASERLDQARLYLLLTGARCPASLDWTIAEAALGGVDVVQMREKDLTDRELLDRARRMRAWTRQADLLFIINDRPDIARLVEADGVHLGQDDLPVAAARRIVGPECLIGVSTHNRAQLMRAIDDGADYLGVGPVFPSSTKSFEELAGLEYVREASELTAIPFFALGGIVAENVQQVVDAGASRIAVSAAIAAADEPRHAAMALRTRLVSSASHPSG